MLYDIRAMACSIVRVQYCKGRLQTCWHPIIYTHSRKALTKNRNIFLETWNGLILQSPFNLKGQIYDRGVNCKSGWIMDENYHFCGFSNCAHSSSGQKFCRRSRVKSLTCCRILGNFEMYVSAGKFRWSLVHWTACNLQLSAMTSVSDIAFY